MIFYSFSDVIMYIFSLQSGKNPPELLENIGICYILKTLKSLISNKTTTTYALQ